MERFLRYWFHHRLLHLFSYDVVETSLLNLCFDQLFRHNNYFESIIVSGNNDNFVILSFFFGKHDLI